LFDVLRRCAPAAAQHILSPSAQFFELGIFF